MTADGTKAAPLWTAEILTLYPEMFPGPLGESLAGKALAKNLWAMNITQIRDYATDRHRTVDAPPAGGGPGMVMRADILAAALDDVAGRGGPVVYLSPRGARLDQAMVRNFAAEKAVTFLCGRFEGVDERLLTHRKIREVSLGDFILSGGELAAMAVIDAVVRTIPGVIGDQATLEEESFESGLLEYPHYTRPRLWEDMAIPEVLQSGHHGRIRAWRREQAEKITQTRRPDLWAAYTREKAAQNKPKI